MEPGGGKRGTRRLKRLQKEESGRKQCFRGENTRNVSPERKRTTRNTEPLSGHFFQFQKYILKRIGNVFCVVCLWKRGKKVKIGARIKPKNERKF